MHMRGHIQVDDYMHEYILDAFKKFVGKACKIMQIFGYLFAAK